MKHIGTLQIHAYRKRWRGRQERAGFVSKDDGLGLQMFQKVDAVNQITVKSSCE